jgi:hypothetical protein
MLTHLALAAQLLRAAQADAPHGDYVEARTAAVFAGACHFGGQYTTDGDAAVLGWHFDGGRRLGVSLSDLDLVLVVVADANLAEAAAVRRTVAFVDQEASVDQGEALLDWLRAEESELAGALVGVESAPVSVAVERAAVAGGADAFRLVAGAKVELRGSSLPDRACCRMPYLVWYEPLVDVCTARVGRADEFRVASTSLGRSWSRPDENCAFYASFGRGNPVHEAPVQR